MNFWRHKKKRNWFCNRPLSPLEESHNDTVPALEDVNKEDAGQHESVSTLFPQANIKVWT